MSMGKVLVESIDDSEEMQIMDVRKNVGKIKENEY